MKKYFFKIKKKFRKRIFFTIKDLQMKNNLSKFNKNSLSEFKSYNKVALWTSELKAKRSLIKVKLT